MFTPGITILRMKHAVSGLEESDLALLDVFQCCLREVSACCHVACQCIQYLIVFCSVVIVGFVLIYIQAYSFILKHTIKSIVHRLQGVMPEVLHSC